MKALILSTLALAISCATTQNSKALTHQDHIKEFYDAGEKAFADKEWEDAIKQFEEVRNKYPYSKYAVLSDLRLGDVYFAQEKWLEAADAYDFYLRFHPRHEQNAYAAFRVAESYVKASPKDFFLFPKSYLRDQSSTTEALAALDRYIGQYPNDKNIAQAHQMRANLRSQMALRDLSVAQFYLKRKNLNGAKARLEYVQKTYPEIPEASRAGQLLEKHLDSKE